jgi:hypothetical protein
MYRVYTHVEFLEFVHGRKNCCHGNHVVTTQRRSELALVCDGDQWRDTVLEIKAYFGLQQTKAEKTRRKRKLMSTSKVTARL